MPFTLPANVNICRGKSLDAAADPAFAPHLEVDTRSAGCKLLHERQF